MSFKIEEHITIKKLLLLLLGIFVFIAIVLTLYFCKFHEGLSTDQGIWGQFGDYVGGTLNPFLTMITFMAILLTILLQKEEIQNDKLDKSKATELEKFYNLLNNNRDLFKSIVVNDIRGESWFALSGPEAIINIIGHDMDSKLMSNIRLKMIPHYDRLAVSLSPALKGKYLHIIGNIEDMNRRADFLAPDGFKDFFKTTDPFEAAKYFGNGLEDELYQISIDILSFNDNIDVITDAFDRFYNDRGYLFGHYIRNHFYLMDFINSMKLHDKEYYSRIARSFLSSSEIILLFYNNFFHKSTLAYRNLVLDYFLLDDLDIQPFMHRSFYVKHKAKLLEYFKVEYKKR